MNPFDIGVPCIKSANSEILFEQYRMALNPEKYKIEVWNDDAIKRNQIFFNLMQQTVNSLDGLCLNDRIILIVTIMKYKMRNQSAEEIVKLKIEKNDRNKIKEGKSKPSPKTYLFWE